MSEFHGAGRPAAGSTGHHAAGNAAENTAAADNVEQPAAAEADAAGTALSAGSPQDILAFVPHCLGFVPQESLVLMTLRGRSLGATLRLDLPVTRPNPRPGPRPAKAWNLAGKGSFEAGYSARICSLLAGDKEADAVLMVVYTEQPWTAGDAPPFNGMVSRLKADLAEQGLSLRDGWLSGNGYWRDYFCASSECCPWPGFPLDQVAGSKLNAELVFRGSAYAASLQAAVGLPGGDGPGGSVSSRLPVDSATARSEAASRQRYEGRWTQPQQFTRTLEAWDQCFKGIRGPQRDGLLLASLESKPVRDTVLVLAAMGLPAALAGSRHWLNTDDPGTEEPDGTAEPPGTAEAGRLFRDVLIGRSSQAPDWACLDRAHEAFTSLLRTATGEPAAALLTLLGWLEWARGRSSRANLCLAAALQVHPGYRLAQLLRTLLMRGELPGWAQSPHTAWRPGITG